MIGCSAALSISGIPFAGPIGAARVGYINGEYVLNPGQTQRKDSLLDLVVAGTEAAVLMVESEAQQLPEEVMLGAVVFGHEQGKIAINVIHELVREAGKPVWDWQAPAKDEAFIGQGHPAGRGEAARRLPDPQQAGPHPGPARGQRSRAWPALKDGGEAFRRRSRSTTCCSRSKRKIVRNQILQGEPRIDGRDTRTVRPIEIRTACCPAPTARRCSRAARPRRWSSPRWAPNATRSASTR
jgi:polyribonucleotide nucleotidyltransferase